MDGLELALRCSNLLLRSMNKPTGNGAAPETSTPDRSAAAISADLESDGDFTDASTAEGLGKRQLSETEAERHFAEAGMRFAFRSSFAGVRFM